MKFTKILCLILCFTFLVTPLWSCDNGSSGGGNSDGGGFNDDGTVNWEGVDFEGATVKVGVSSTKESGGTFKPAKDYLMGPDKTSTDEVLKKVVQRNNKVKTDLNMNVEYMLIDAGDYPGVQEDITTKIMAGPKGNSPDVYTNDLRAFSFALLEGQLKNVATPTDDNGRELTSYFDFTKDCWYYDYMKEFTFDQSKIYVLAGDYHIDMVRAAQVLFINKEMFEENTAKFKQAKLNFNNISDFYKYVDVGDWDYDMLIAFSKAVFVDDGKEAKITDLDDSAIGFVSNIRLYFNFVPSTGMNTFYMDEDGEPQFVDAAYLNELEKMGEKLRGIWHYGDGNKKPGLYHEDGMDCVASFMKGGVLFVSGMLGEMESEQFRDTGFTKGLVPTPKYDRKAQDDYHTMVEAFGEISAILRTAPSFTRASAYLQYINEQSKSVLTEYYEKALKFKYSEDRAIADMIDLVYETIDSPFEIWFETVIQSYASISGGDNLHFAIARDQLGSFYTSNQDAYRAGLRLTLEKFATVP